ncbi:uncharacterized protein EI90DRAFT_3070385, partial [Cantharellus anzutake]|uniref:uncharacterized protein n=1 Tax=Cantharellus anzutake TaxID=1750568 RepID=UPI001906A4F6
MRKAVASHQREKSDLETALDVLKSELAKKSVSLPNRFGSTNGEAGLQEPLDVKSKREIDITQPIPALLNEYDKASQGTKEEKGDLGLGFESVHNAGQSRLVIVAGPASITTPRKFEVGAGTSRNTRKTE